MNSYEALNRSLSNLSMIDETIVQVNQKFGTQQTQYHERIAKFVERI